MFRHFCGNICSVCGPLQNFGNYRAEAGTKKKSDTFFYHFKKRVGESVQTFRTQCLVDFVFKEFTGGSTLKKMNNTFDDIADMYTPFNVELGVSQSNVDSQCNPAYKAFYQICC